MAKMVESTGKKIFIGLSGGVDSSVAAYLLQKHGYDVTGVFIRSYNVDGCAERDAEDARRVAAHLGIPFYVFDFEKEYKKEVVEYMVNGYRNGFTPNPDVMCNKEIKFGLFLDKALSMGADYVATGHYVRFGRTAFRKQHNFLPARKFTSLSPRNSSLRSETKLSGLRDVPQGNPASPYLFLLEGRDGNKDQSYFLWTLTQEQLKYCLFPIGDYLKSEVREIARKASLPTAEKKDSQGICFLGDVELDEFLKDYIKPKKGPIIDTDGNKIGEHMGAQFYTIGQRHLGAKFQIPNSKFQKPFYIVSKDVKTNTIVVAEGDDNPALFKKELKLSDIHFIDPESLEIKNWKLKIPVLARVRYRQPLIPATLIEEEGGKYKLVFKKPVKFVAPGQSAVFYGAGFFAGLRGRKMLGGGIIL